MKFHSEMYRMIADSKMPRVVRKGLMVFLPLGWMGMVYAPSVVVALIPCSQRSPHDWPRWAALGFVIAILGAMGYRAVMVVRAWWLASRTVNVDHVTMGLGCALWSAAAVFLMWFPIFKA